MTKEKDELLTWLKLRFGDSGNIEGMEQEDKIINILKVKLLDAKTVKKAVDAFAKTIESDFMCEETAHWREDHLSRLVLKAIAEDRCVDPKACAKEILRLERLEFHRHFA